jgi:hypothetical protein
MHATTAPQPDLRLEKIDNRLSDRRLNRKSSDTIQFAE